MTACTVSGHQKSGLKSTCPEARCGFDLFRGRKSIALTFEDLVIGLETLSNVSSFWGTQGRQRRIDSVFDMTSLRFCRIILELDLELAAELDERIADTVRRMKFPRCA
jgi:hypothetical protein